MVDYELSELFLKSEVNKQWLINSAKGKISITNEELEQQSIELTESLCSEENLRFGCCEASMFKFKVHNVVLPMKGKKITVWIVLDGNDDNPFLVGQYKVYSDKATANKKFREIVAYDSMYDILNADVSKWYNGLKFPMKLKEFRDSFFGYLGIEQEPISLVNDSVSVKKTIDPTSLSGKTVITAICELNGCFGHIGRNGKFKYVFLKELAEALHPSDTLYPSDNLFPSDSVNSEKISKKHYIEATYEDFITSPIGKILLRGEENDVGTPYPEGNVTDSDNCYIIEDNFLIYGKTTEDTAKIAKNIYSVVSKVRYRPAHLISVGNPCLEIGDGIRFSTKYEIVYTYILQRTLKGTMALKDSYDAEGEQYQSEKVNSLRESIIQLKGKTNTLTRTIEETKSTVKDVEYGLQSQITQNASSIALEVTRAQTKEEELSASITINADAITSEVKRATETEGVLSSKIVQNATSITLKVSKNSVISEINQTAESIKISAEKINLNGVVSIINNGGTTTINGDRITTGTITADEIKAGTITLSKLNIDSISAKFAVVSDIEAINAEIRNIKADYITAAKVKADYMEVSNWTSAGYIKASKINVDELTVKQIYLSDSKAKATVASAKGYLFSSPPTLKVTKNDSGYVTDVKIGSSFVVATVLTRYSLGE